MSINLISVAIILAILFLVYLLLKFNNYLRELAYQGFLRVEKLYVSGHGEQKMNEVIDMIISSVESITIVGPILTIFLTKKNLKKIIQKFFDEIKDFLDDGKIERNGKNEISR